MRALADKWKKAPRPWARKQILAYLAQPLNCPGHQPVVKHLFKYAEEHQDHELMAAFLVAFDRQVRRERRTTRRWDFRSRDAYDEEKLVTARDARLFKYRTRYYLRRRAWRYFRRLGHRDPAAYVTAIINPLAAFEDRDLQLGDKGTTVEIDEAYIGGQLRHKGSKVAKAAKTMVIGLAERDGRIHLQSMSDRRFESIKPVLDAKLAEDTKEVVTDGKVAECGTVTRCERDRCKRRVRIRSERRQRARGCRMSEKPYIESTTPPPGYDPAREHMLDFGVDADLAQVVDTDRKNFILTTVDEVFNWARLSSIWPVTFGLACCAIEMMAASATRYDIDRFGAGAFRPTRPVSGAEATDVVGRLEGLAR